MNTLSLRLRPLAAAILCSLITPALFAQTATTTPVGFITITIPAAVDASTPTSTTVSIPLYGTADYVSTVASLDSSSAFTLTGAAWTAGQFAVASAPRLVRVKTSTAVPANIGKFFLVSANTTNQLTVTLPPGVADINTAISVGDSCEVVPANTLGIVFGVAPTPLLQTGATASSADNVYIWNGLAWDTYFNNGTIWKKSGTIGNTDRKDTVIYPDEGLFVVRTVTSSVALTLMGTVPSTTEQTSFQGAGSTFLPNRFPTDTTLGALGLQNMAGWTSGTTAGTADTVYLWNGTGWDTYFYTGSIWKKSGLLGNVDKSSTPIPTGSAVFVNRTAAGQASLTQALPYVP